MGRRYGTWRVAASIVVVTGLSTQASARGTFATLTKEGLPNVQAAAATVVDLDTGATLFSRKPDKVRFIASTGKIFVALAVRREDIDLSALTEIERSDEVLARGGAPSRLLVGHRFRNLDLLKAMLISSDNRAPSALGRAVGLSADQLIAKMNDVARDLGLAKTHFSDTSGLRGNQSTAREMAVALAEALRDPVLREIMQTRSVTIRSRHRRSQLIAYRNTNRVLHSGRYEILGGKTGFTDAAGYCLLVAARLAGRNVAMVFLGERAKLTRFGDFGRVATWLESDDAKAGASTGLAVRSQVATP